jgi:predicted phage tail protein
MPDQNPLFKVWRYLKTNSYKTTLLALGLEFWLPLPLIGVSIWLGGKSVANQMLSYKYDTKSYLEANNQVKVNLSVALVAIKAEMKQQAGFTKVSIKTADSAIKNLELELPTTDISAIEAGITQELGLDLTTVKRITRYQFTE